jgi:predicted N-acyltransferase
VSCLHFECCYYQMIEFAIEQRLAVFEGGAQGAHKLARGLDPVATASAHWLAEPAMRAAVARFIARETGAVEDTLDELNEHRAWRRTEAGADTD